MTEQQMKRFYIINENNDEEFDGHWFNEAKEEKSLIKEDKKNQMKKWQIEILEMTKDEPIPFIFKIKNKKYE